MSEGFEQVKALDEMERLKSANKAMHEALEGILADLENVIQPYVLEATKEALAKADKIS